MTTVRRALSAAPASAGCLAVLLARSPEVGRRRHPGRRAVGRRSPRVGGGHAADVHVAAEVPGRRRAHDEGLGLPARDRPAATPTPPCSSCWPGKRPTSRPARAVALLDEALELWRGPAYAEEADVCERARRGPAAGGAPEPGRRGPRAGLLLEAGREPEAVAAAEALVAGEPLREGAWAVLVGGAGAHRPARRGAAGLPARRGGAGRRRARAVASPAPGRAGGARRGVRRTGNGSGSGRRGRAGERLAPAARRCPPSSAVTPTGSRWPTCSTPPAW